MLRKTRRGDTLVEVTFAIAAFALISIITINVMNSGLNKAQATLELTHVRGEMNAQAEAIRFIHNAFTLERERPTSEQQYRELWMLLSRQKNSTASPSAVVNDPEDVPNLTVNRSCQEIYDGMDDGTYRAFIMNTRVIDPTDKTFVGVDGRNLSDIVITTKNSRDKFIPTTLNSRVVYGKNEATTTNNTDAEMLETGFYRDVQYAEGIFIVAARDKTNNASLSSSTPEFFDYHIRACWVAPGDTVPTTIGTIMRLYNPELVEGVDLW
ncbi:hypothetical protein IJG79_00745 [Candidatus Saccharibacteria bacterium]|nr:hypothetical protein [Candidatus Saccharibacteria bacterium]